MRISIHDFGGYPYPFALSRNLATRGHEVQHVYCVSHYSTPAGTFQKHSSDPQSLEIVPVHLSATLDKERFVRRWRQELEYGVQATDATLEFKPDVVLSANMPLDAQGRLVRACRETNIPFVFWVQDLIGLATYRILRKKIPLLGSLIGRYYMHVERRQLKHSNQIIVLTEDFVPILTSWGLNPSQVHVIHNWAPMDQFPMKGKVNQWSLRNELHNKRCFIYAGTLSLKHNPNLLLQLALKYRDDHDVRVVVLTQGLGGEWLKEQSRNHRLNNLIILPYEPVECMSEVMATADVLVAILEPDAGAYSVPSKVLVYLCAARPLLLAMPPENLAARIVTQQEAGIVVNPADLDGFLVGADLLLCNAAARETAGANARAYAEKTFRIDSIAEQFLAVLRDAVNA